VYRRIFIAELVQSEPGFQLARRANRLVIDRADPAFVLLNGSAACASATAEFGNDLEWEYRQYPSAEPGKSKTLWHYEGFLNGASGRVPVVGFPFLRSPRTHNSNAEVQQLAAAIRSLTQTP
jgi:hypothetical protein